MKKLMKTFVSNAIFSMLPISFSPGISLTEETFQSDAQHKTSDDQKNNRADIDLTAAIRRVIVADKTLSVSAHNVKIITEHGMVTLNGKVDSEEEKDAVVQKARDLAGASNVTDNLTVSRARKNKRESN